MCDDEFCLREWRKERKRMGVLMPVPISTGQAEQAHDTAICSACKQLKNTPYKNASGALICRACYQRTRYKNPSTYELCSICTKIKPVSTRDKVSGKPI